MNAISERIHPSIELIYPFDPSHKMVEIDIEIVPLIKKIWSLGFETVASCQELPNNSAVAESLSVGGCMWVRLAFNYDLDELFKECPGLKFYRRYKDIYIRRTELPY